MTAQMPSTRQDDHAGQIAGRDRPDRFLAAALRLIACPCGAPLHDTLRPGSAAAALLDFVRVIDHHARRPLILHPAARDDLSADETALVALIACLQAGHDREATLRCRSLVRPAGQSALVDAAGAVARRLASDAITLPPPSSAAPFPGGPSAPLRLVAAG